MTETGSGRAARRGPGPLGLMLAGVVALALIGCGQGAENGATSEGHESEDEMSSTGTSAETMSQAERLAEEFIIVDTHIDVPYRLHNGGMEDISLRTEKGDFDYPRAKRGGLDAAFMSIYIPARFENEGAKELADQLIDMVEGFEREWPDKFRVATTVDQVRAAAADGVIALPMGMENGAPIEGDASNLEYFRDRGIRYITLTHSENNHISDSSFAKEKKWNGLSPFGREVVDEMNRLGIMIDISHVSDDAFYQVIEASKVPVIASHSSCRRFTVGWERNMNDDMIKRLAENGGVIQINFGSAFLQQQANEQSQAYWNAVRAFKAENGLAEEDPTPEGFSESYWKTHERVYADLDDVVANIDHVVRIAGVDHVGIGSDFDGVGDSLPVGLKDVSQYPNLIAALLDRGYTSEDIRKICGENLLRVWSEVERFAAAAESTTRSAGS